MTSFHRAYPNLPRRFWHFVPLALCLFGLAALANVPLKAQDAAGLLTGTVVDISDSKYLEGAEVSVQGTEIRTTTSRDGTFVLRNVPTGAQTVVANYPGSENVSVAVTVAAGQNPPLDVRFNADVVQLGEFKVSGTKEGMAQAVALQKMSVQFKMVAAADQFGAISEGNVGEYLKFLPGISIDYNVNDARGVSLRGLSTAFTIVAVDGTPMAGTSSIDDTRRFEFEQIAMNNVETTELFKSVTPDIPASATGGYVNFVTKSAFDTQDVQRLTYDLSFSAPSSNVSFGKEGGVWGNKEEYTIRPNLELNFSRKVSDKLGVNFNYRLSEKYDDSPRTELTWVTTTTAPNIMANARLRQANIRSEQKLTHREAFATKLDYLFSDQTKLTLSGQWNWYDLKFTQRGPGFILGDSATSSGTAYVSGASGASIQNGVLFREKYGTTYHFNSSLSHSFGNGSKLSVTPYWSRADGQYRDTSKGFISSVTSMAASSSTYTPFHVSDVALGQLPEIALFNGTTPVSLDLLRSLGNYTFSNTTGTNMQSRPWTAIDKKRGFRADYNYDLDVLALPISWQTGIAYDEIERTIDRPDFRWTVPSTTGSALAALLDPNYTKDVAFGFGSFQVVDPYKVWETFRGNSFVLNTHDYRAFEEENTAAYLRADVTLLSDLLLVGGVRWEKREISASGQNRASATSRFATVNLDYDEWYPSLTLKYTPRREIVVRSGVIRTVGHPDYSDLIPTYTAETTPGAANGSLSVPDSDLKPYFSINYDLSFDYYLKNSGVIGLSTFRKDVKNYISSRGMTGAEISELSAAYGFNAAEFSSGTVRVNGGKSRLQGFELSYAQNLTFLPKPLDGFNVQANFTYVDIDSFDSDPLAALDTLYSQLRAVSPKTANFVLGYRYKKLSITSTTNWVDESLYGGFVSTNFFTGTANTTNQALDTRLTLNKDEKLTTDIKLEYSFSPRFTAYFLVRNLTNSARKEFLRGYLPQNQNVVLPMRYFEFGEPHFTLGLRGRF